MLARRVRIPGLALAVMTDGGGSRVEARSNGNAAPEPNSSTWGEMNYGV
jgi:hypothetical protein